MAKNPMDESARHEAGKNDPAQDKTEVCPMCGQDASAPGPKAKVKAAMKNMKTKSVPKGKYP